MLLDIIFEDDDIIVVNKPRGIVMYQGFGHDDGTLVQGVLAHTGLSSIGVDGLRPGVVHRIDKDTSGLVVFAKTREAHKALSLAFENRQAEKTYIAVIHGRPVWPDGKTFCELPLVPDGNKKHLTIIDKFRGKASRTAFTLLFSAGNYSAAEARPETGRTHQIRVHLSALGCPVVCDSLYGKNARSGNEKGVCLSSFKRNWLGNTDEERPLLDRLGLHASRIVFNSLPYRGLTLEAPLARDMAALIKQMEKNRT
jgi:RluA family pseudouridine synthase